jgi:hypothetical protein
LKWGFRGHFASISGFGKYCRSGLMQNKQKEKAAKSQSKGGDIVK